MAPIKLAEDRFESRFSQGAIQSRPQQVGEGNRVAFIAGFPTSGFAVMSPGMVGYARATADAFSG